MRRGEFDAPKVFFALLPPLLIAGTTGGWLLLHETFRAWSFAAVVATALLVTLLESVAPARAEWRSRAKEMVSDAFYLVGRFFLYGPAISLYARRPLVAWLAGARAGLRFELWPSRWPLLGRVMLAVLVAEFFGYWFHRAEHRWKFAWRLHVTHHSSTKLNWLKATVNHPFELLFLELLAFTPVALLGAGPAEMDCALMIVSIVGLLAHSNLPAPMRAFGWVFNTNVLHVRHHSIDVKEGNSNFGCCLIVWDRLFGTYRPHPASERLGIGAGDEVNLKNQLLLPFR